MEPEGLAIIFGLNKFQQYLEHRPFVIQCDNSPLTHILNHPRQVWKIARWISLINSFSLTVEQIPGITINVADVLSRMFVNTEPNEVELLRPFWMAKKV